MLLPCHNKASLCHTVYSSNRLKQSKRVSLKSLLELFGLENDWMMVDSISAFSLFSPRLLSCVVSLSASLSNPLKDTSISQ